MTEEEKKFLQKISQGLAEYERKKSLKERLFNNDPKEVIELRSILKKATSSQFSVVLDQLYRISFYSQLPEGHPIYNVLLEINNFVQITRGIELKKGITIIKGVICDRQTRQPLKPQSRSTAGRLTLRLSDEIKQEIGKSKAIVINNDHRVRQPVKQAQVGASKITSGILDTKQEISASVDIKKVTDLPYDGENPQSDVVFLVEGLRDDSKSIIDHQQLTFLSSLFAHSIMPDFHGTIDWAIANHCPIIDPIVSYDCPIVIAEVLEKTFKLNSQDAEERQKRIVLGLCREFSSRNPTLESLSYMIVAINQAFAELKRQRKIKEIPSWAANLDIFKYIQLKEQYIKKYYGIHVERFLQDIRASNLPSGLYSLGFDDIYNRISRDRLIEYLIAHPNVKTIYAMVGKYHVGMIGRKWGDKNLSPLQPIKINQEDDDTPGLYAHVQLAVGERFVEVHMFGGAHGRDGQYMKFKQIAKNNGLKEPDSLFRFQRPAYSEAVSISFSRLTK